LPVIVSVGTVAKAGVTAKIEASKVVNTAVLRTSSSDFIMFSIILLSRTNGWFRSVIQPDRDLIGVRAF
jgi:hypothetical protein